MRLALVCFYCLCVFAHVFYFIATMPFAGYFLSVLFCLLSMLISDSRLDLVWFRLSCDHVWIRSGSVNVRKQQQQQRGKLKNPDIKKYVVLQTPSWSTLALPHRCTLGCLQFLSLNVFFSAKLSDLCLFILLHRPIGQPQLRTESILLSAS